RKLMSTINEDSGQYFVAVKGAPDQLLKRVTRIELDGKVSEITEKQKDEIMLSNQNMAKNALRVLGLAYKTVEQLYDDSPWSLKIGS
ncbi:MAG: hypothetical protein M3Z87_22520, partial [Lactobacillus sp.]|nr:hypothetical protein [Lactobacillus sp.]